MVHSSACVAPRLCVKGWESETLTALPASCVWPCHLHSFLYQYLHPPHPHRDWLCFHCSCLCGECCNLPPSIPALAFLDCFSLAPGAVFSRQSLDLAFCRESFPDYWSSLGYHFPSSLVTWVALYSHPNFQFLVTSICTLSVCIVPGDGMFCGAYSLSFWDSWDIQLLLPGVSRLRANSLSACRLRGRIS